MEMIMCSWDTWGGNLSVTGHSFFPLNWANLKSQQNTSIGLDQQLTIKNLATGILHILWFIPRSISLLERAEPELSHIAPTQSTVISTLFIG